MWQCDRVQLNGKNFSLKEKVHAGAYANVYLPLNWACSAHKSTFEYLFLCVYLRKIYWFLLLWSAFAWNFSNNFQANSHKQWIFFFTIYDVHFSVWNPAIFFLSFTNFIIVHCIFCMRKSGNSVFQTLCVWNCKPIVCDINKTYAAIGTFDNCFNVYSAPPNA